MAGLKVSQKIVKNSHNIAYAYMVGFVVEGFFGLGFVTFFETLWAEGEKMIIYENKKITWFKTFKTKKLPHFRNPPDVSFLMVYPV